MCACTAPCWAGALASPGGAAACLAAGRRLALLLAAAGPDPHPDCRHPPRCTLHSAVQVLDGAGIRDPFIRNWLDLLCFLLSGLPANGTIAAAVAFMFEQW